MDNVTYGTISPIWTDEYKSFEYSKQPLMEEEIKNWRTLGYYHESFSGHMYDSRNTMPNWVNSVAERVGLTNCGFVFYKLTTLDIMPNHVDHFETYRRVFNVDRNDVYRALVFLEDWAPGQYLEVDHKLLSMWKAGDYVRWHADTDHASANIGTTDRYALQITGTLL